MGVGVDWFALRWRGHLDVVLRMYNAVRRSDFVVV